MAEQNSQTYAFQADVSQVLDLVTNSLYSNKEIFLRELISNASDALDKLRFLALSNSDYYEGDADLKIRVSIDKENRLITISDNGIGMNEEDVVSHLGTIAKSGTKEFFSQLKEQQEQDSNLIGQFGVGFYSAFIVADSVTVRTRKAGSQPSEAVEWRSDGKGEFNIEHIEKTNRGTDIVLHLKDDEDEFLNNWTVKNTVTKYSDYICWPIEMLKDTPDETASEDEKTAEDTTTTSPEFETINKATALWTLQKSQIKDEDYQALYKQIGHDFENPLTWVHNHVEGKQQYISLLYIPTRAPFDLWQQESKHGLKLYVKRVFILDDADQFLPRYLRFVKGIIDSSDLPLNVSRELLQDNRQVQAIKSACTKRVLSLLERMQNDDSEKYNQFWDAFGQVIKEGLIEDFSNKELLSKLLLFSTTHDDSEKQRITLADYVNRMKEGQEKIYYVTASTFNAAKNSPHLEILRKKGYEVLLLSERVDEWLVNHLSEFDGKSLQSVTKGELDITDNEESSEEKAEQAKNFDSLLKQMKDILEDRVKEIRLTHRLTDSPACVVADANDMGLEMQRILQSAGQQAPKTPPIFEINPEHRIIEQLNQETDDERLKDWVLVLLDQAILAEGGELDDPAQYVKRISGLMTRLAG